MVMFTYETAPVAGGGRRITTPARREPLPSWAAATTGTEDWYLNGNGDRALSDKPSAGWSRPLTAAHGTTATAMDDIMTPGQQE